MVPQSLLRFHEPGEGILESTLFTDELTLPVDELNSLLELLKPAAQAAWHGLVLLGGPRIVHEVLARVL